MYGSRKLGGLGCLGKEEQEFVEMKSLDVCGKTVVSRGKNLPEKWKDKNIKEKTA